jgi:hypothetical protein
MSHAVFKPLLRQARAQKTRPAATKRPIKRIGRQEMIERRDRCMTEIAHHRDESIPNTFFAKARHLLTRHWYPSSWRARADILRSAEWLVRVGQKRS